MHDARCYFHFSYAFPEICKINRRFSSRATAEKFSLLFTINSSRVAFSRECQPLEGRGEGGGGAPLLDEKQ